MRAACGGYIVVTYKNLRRSKATFEHRKFVTVRMTDEAIAGPTSTPVSRVLCLLTVFGFIRSFYNKITRWLTSPDTYSKSTIKKK